MAKVEVGLIAQRIYQDLVEENGFSDSYESEALCEQAASEAATANLPIGMSAREEVQLDFGLGAPIDTSQGKSPAQFGAELFFSSLQRDTQPSGYRDVHTLFGKWVAQL
jgi:hypothetical protein